MIKFIIFTHVVHFAGLVTLCYHRAKFDGKTLTNQLLMQAYQNNL